MTYHHMLSLTFLTLLLLAGVAALAAGPQVGFSADNGLVIVRDGKTDAIVVVSPDAKGQWEKAAAADLVKYIGLMSGAKPALANTAETVAAALAGKAPVFVIGEAAFAAAPTMKTALTKITKANPVIRADAVIVKQAGNRIYIAGSNDESHYYAMSWLLEQWGCHWYLPTEIGECIPSHPTLTVNNVNYVYAPPFEMRNYWLSWNGDGTGAKEFQMHNFINGASYAGMGHALGQFTGDLAKSEGKSVFNIPFSEQKTADEIVKKMGPGMEQKPGYGISLAIEDGNFENDSKEDARLQAGLYDKYMLKPMMTDPMMALYSNVGKQLDAKYPGNPTGFGGMAYTNVTIPPQAKFDIPSRLVMWIAPIDIDPNHGMDDPLSPPRQEYKEMMYRWADVMQGRVCIYDYDQGMLVWRDLPDPSQMAFAQDVKHYAKAGIIGVNTESRGATATIFTNHYFRGQLMWNPNVDVKALEQDFYTNFYGPAAAPMGLFWDAIFTAFTKTVVTEHEYMAAPAIYTPELMAGLAKNIAAANAAIAPLEKQANRTRNEELYLQRMIMARKQWAVLDGYMRMVQAAATSCDYTKAGAIGKQGMAARIDLAKMNPTFTTHVVGPGAEPTEPAGDAAWWPGEVKQYLDLASLTDGTKGTMIIPLPLEWAFHRDPRDTGLARGWAYQKADLTFWNANKAKYDLYTRKDYPTTEWETLRTDLYAQAQGIRHPDNQSFTGFLWYKTNVNLKAADVAGPVHLMFPGLFNEGWLYVNGNLVAHRDGYQPMWWINSYKFEWDVDLTGKLKAGDNDITLRCDNPHHFGGIFRRPFLYRAK